ncbi:MAG TPA: ATP-binding cassette domain-containing protein, partial [Planctomycetota bacterium]|nr:ATP-binding cassette domain-containing protein [Planctomycetota bacterium]
MVGFSGFTPRHENIIRLSGVAKEYATGPAQVRALRPATLTIEPGEFILLQGPSGSGKTTLLSIMGCLMKPSAGRVFLCGKDVTEMGESELPGMRLRHIGFIFQT